MNEIKQTSSSQNWQQDTKQMAPVHDVSLSDAQIIEQPPKWSGGLSKSTLSFYLE